MTAFASLPLPSLSLSPPTIQPPRPLASVLQPPIDIPNPVIRHYRENQVCNRPVPPNLKTNERTSPFHSKSSLLCSASWLALTRPDGPVTSGGSEAVVTQPKGSHSASGRHEEERVLISEVLVRNKDGEEMERRDLEDEALAALKACRPNSALTVREVKEDVHRIIDTGYFCSCLPVAVDTRDGIRLVFQA
ncbi:unnamed protein product [Thlaspi arvense]|uniref:Uncharacterized protein n=1 Tax=Thlaspi arvense TaxID=13288 RepID=A0AAU9SXA6_THLAR|nr:unnamed protein product [Thlaspi arvense]